MREDEEDGTGNLEMREEEEEENNWMEVEFMQVVVVVMCSLDSKISE